MSLLTSNIQPLAFGKGKTMADLFALCADKGFSDVIRISTGYISLDSMIYLLENFRRNNINSCELVIGMHKWSGFTKSQYDVVSMFDKEIRYQNRGFVNICVSFPFHGKAYSFWKNNSAVAAMIGSSNLDSILGDKHLDYEVDAFFEDANMVGQVTNLQDKLIKDASIPFSSWQPPKIITEPVFPPEQDNVEILTKEEIDNYWKRAKSLTFLLELKTEPKSNLNCTFGKGRENTRTKLIRPRPWYEVEIIISSSITSQKGFPIGREFEVITDDGYKFWCQSQGDYGKNFRSKTDLTILGTWIKGQMEAAGALHVGEPVTPNTIRAFGRNKIKLIATDNPNLWLIKLV